MGLVYAKRTSGRYVTEDESMIEERKKMSALQVIREFRDKMQALGYDEDEMIHLISESKEEQDI